MDVIEFDIPLFSPNVTEINFEIFNLWIRGHNEKEVFYLLQNTFYSSIDKMKNEEMGMSYRDYVLINKIYNKDGKENLENNKPEKLNKDKAKDNILFVKDRIMNMFNNENKDPNSVIGVDIFFHHFLCLYIKQQFYIFNILSYHLTNLDVHFSNFYMPINKNKILKLIKIYYNIDFDLEKEIIKYKSINNINKYTNELVKITGIHKISVKRQIENIKKIWKYIINIYEARDINVSTLHKKTNVSVKKVIKFIKANFHWYKFFINKKRETVIDINDYHNRGSKSISMKNKGRKRKRKKKGQNANSKNEYHQYNIIKTLENLLGIYLSKRYFRMYWIISYHIEFPKKTNAPYSYFNNIILLLLEKLQINDLILSKEYINISKHIYTTFNKTNKNFENLKTQLYKLVDMNNSSRTKSINRLKCIMNILCCFRNGYEITKFLVIFCELQKNEPIVNEKTFIKHNIGNYNFVNRMMCFIKEAENYSKLKQANFNNQKMNEKNKIVNVL
ncbi:conserved Plasmodium protein, unknown function [Plasmodium chabaudi adami]|uniref:Uncharacterized protein n=1 Tax=Plasmodium chabaudi adami TaxID=5826 RepID=A0A1C6XTJ7_PLACE|nr:conserved Plasmodium protein, unknown function [Plasmodium chabaudi adami]